MSPNDPRAEMAELDYGDAEFTIRRPGHYVLCAVSQSRISLEALRYWSVDRQEAYAGPAEALKRELETGSGS